MLIRRRQDCGSRQLEREPGRAGSPQYADDRGDERPPRQEKPMRRPRDAAMRKLPGPSAGLVPISTEYFAFVSASGGCERRMQPPAARSCPAEMARDMNGEQKTDTTPAVSRPASGRRGEGETPVNGDAVAGESVRPGATGRPPAPQRGFQTDLGELAEEFAECTEYTDCNTGECRVKVLPTLYRIIRLIADSQDLANALPIILGVMEQRMRMGRGMISLLDRASGTIFIHASFGLTDEQKACGLYAPGEGIIGRVVASGKAIVAPSLRNNPLFLNRTGSHRNDDGTDCTFVCVPILTGGKVLGTISGERSYASNRLLKQDFELLATIASMIAPAVELYLLENIERKNLENENRRLHAALKEKFKPANIIALADHFVARFARDAGKEVTRISTPALNMLMSYHWPGNVRELENVIERSVILCDDGVIHGYNMPPSLQMMRTAEDADPAAAGGLQSRVDAVEYEMIVDALKLHLGNTTDAARELKITRRTLGLRMAKYGLNYRTYRGGT